LGFGGSGVLVLRQATQLAFPAPAPGPGRPPPPPQPQPSAAAAPPPHPHLVRVGAAGVDGKQQQVQHVEHAGVDWSIDGADGTIKVLRLRVLRLVAHSVADGTGGQLMVPSGKWMM
jgi:hypothetical protein